MTIPSWQAPTSGQPPLAAHVNQFLGAHPSIELYTASQTAGVTTNGTAHTNSHGLYMAQSFTTAVGQTTVGYVSAPIGSYTSSGDILGTTTISLYADSAGAPTGSALISATITTEYAQGVTGGADTIYVSYPLPIAGLSASTQYWIVTSPAGNPISHYTWRQSASASGASTSPDGTTWTAQAYGLQYRVFDRTASGNRVHTWENNGARWTWYSYNTDGTIHATGEYTVGQTATGYMQSMRNYTYSFGKLSGVA